MPCRKWKYSADDALAIVIFLAIGLSQRRFKLDCRRGLAMIARDHGSRRALARLQRPGKETARQKAARRERAENWSRGCPPPQCPLEAARLNPPSAPPT